MTKRLEPPDWVALFSFAMAFSAWRYDLMRIVDARTPAGGAFFCSAKRTKMRLKRNAVSLENLFLLLFVPADDGVSSSGSAAGIGVIRLRLIPCMS